MAILNKIVSAVAGKVASSAAKKAATTSKTNTSSSYPAAKTAAKTGTGSSSGSSGSRLQPLPMIDFDKQGKPIPWGNTGSKAGDGSWIGGYNEYEDDGPFFNLSHRDPVQAPRKEQGQQSGASMPSYQEQYPNPYADQMRETYAQMTARAAEIAAENERKAKELYASVVKQGSDRLNSQRQGINQGYDSAAQQAYVAYMQGQKAMPGQMAAMGMNGGASESTLLGARSSYEGNQNNIATARQGAMTGIDSAITDLQNSGDVQAAQYSIDQASKRYDDYLKAGFADIGRADALDQQAWQRAYNDAALTGQYRGQQTLDARNMAFNQALQESSVTGQYKGQRTLAAQDMFFNQGLQEAGMTGRYRGQQTLDALNADRQFSLQEGMAMGQYKGAPTMDAQQFEYGKSQDAYAREWDKTLFDYQKEQDIYNRQLTEQEIAREIGMYLMQGGLVNEATAKAFGVSMEDMRRVQQQMMYGMGGSGGGGGSSGRSSGSGSGRKKTTKKSSGSGSGGSSTYSGSKTGASAETLGKLATNVVQAASPIKMPSMPTGKTQTGKAQNKDTSRFGPSYGTAWKGARDMFDKGKKTQEIARYLDQFDEKRLTEAGLNQIMKSINLGK